MAITLYNILFCLVLFLNIAKTILRHCLLLKVSSYSLEEAHPVAFLVEIFHYSQKLQLSKKSIKSDSYYFQKNTLSIPPTF